MIKELGIDLPLNPCICGDPKGVGFWFKGCNENTQWAVKHTGVACRKSTLFFNSKTEAQKQWNAIAIATTIKEQQHDKSNLSQEPKA